MPSKKSPLLKIETAKGMPHGEEFEAVITRHQFEKLPLWVRNVIDVWGVWDNERHVYFEIQAKDELQAMMRFNQLWDGLPKKGPNDA